MSASKPGIYRRVNSTVCFAIDFECDGKMAGRDEEQADVVPNRVTLDLSALFSLPPSLSLWEGKCGYRVMRSPPGFSEA